MRLNLKKCIFVSTSVQYLGHMVSAKGVTPGKEKTNAIAKASEPSCQKKLRSFLGLANYFRSYFPRFAQWAAPLFQLMRKCSEWKENTPLPDGARAAFKKIKAAIVSQTCMAYPRRDRKYTLQVDTCLLYTSPSPRDKRQSRMPSSA